MNNALIVLCEGRNAMSTETEEYSESIILRRKEYSESIILRRKEYSQSINLRRKEFYEKNILIERTIQEVMEGKPTENQGFLRNQ